MRNSTRTWEFVALDCRMPAGPVSPERAGPLSVGKEQTSTMNHFLPF
jgi:hypothetical protein